MKKSILNIGKTLTRIEQKSIFGGNFIIGGDDCPANECNVPGKTCNAGESCTPFNWTESCPKGDTIRYACMPS